MFTTTCTVGEHVTEGDGNSKKISKKRAAEKMLEELKKLPTFKKTVAQPKIQKPKRKPQQPKKKTRNLIKVIFFFLLFLSLKLTLFLLYELCILGKR